MKTQTKLHKTYTEPTNVTGRTLHWPRCSCGWAGSVVRTAALARAQRVEHISPPEGAEGPLFTQLALF